MTDNPIDGFFLKKEDFKFIGEGLQRPECILAEKDGTLWSADARGGVVRIDANGNQTVITQSHSAEAFQSSDDDAQKFVDGTLPNGLAFASNGDILISNFGTDCLERMTRTGDTEVMFDSVDGEPIGKVNFVCRDSKDRIWITISTMLHDWPKAINKDLVDGRVLLYEEGKGVRIVADDVHFSNECKLDKNEEYLYVVQTCGRNIARYRIKEDGSLGPKEIYGPNDHGRLIDGIAFDAHGNLWGTHVMNDGIFAIKPDGDLHIIFDDSSPEEVKMLDDAFQAGTVDTELLLQCGGGIATWCASITFGGQDLKTVYVGSLRATNIPYFQSPVAGLPMVHWNE
ncbi:MAG: gluconolactonase [Rhodospirillaceae bacterium]|nr:gluconolactonase [Rhodospirillaceae bacterium]|tara:strand:- start:1534 stop:2556 length:1023 start_codon:yes stop_codon:yes gene_type:complete